jgi:three-Cys-motif partner protein
LAKKHYDWTDGPAEIDAHSLTKHEVLVDYLRRYFEQRTLNARGRDVFRITLVDGFCGGGLYTLKSTGQEILGSPLRMLAAVEEAQILVNQGRKKPVALQVQYVFVDHDASAVRHLETVLRLRGYGESLGSTIHLITSEFGQASDQVLRLVTSHTPRSTKALFFLDQYGYSDVPAPLIKKILTGLPNSEVVLTFHVASFATYTNDDFTSRIEETLQIDIRSCLGGQSIDAIKSNEADWRRFIQGALYQALVADCGARFFTPFFIRGEGSGHGEYWLVHLSQHHRAQDVMKQVHWQHQNHFIHYGGAGLNMLAPHTMGFMQEFTGGFRFDDVARHESDSALREQLAVRIYALDRPKTFGEVFAATCNESPATAGMYKDTLAVLAQERDIIVTGADGRPKRHARYMTDTDVIRRSDQHKLFI